MDLEGRLVEPPSAVFFKRVTDDHPAPRYLWMSDITRPSLMFSTGFLQFAVVDLSKKTFQVHVDGIDVAFVNVTPGIFLKGLVGTPPGAGTRSSSPR
jgi:hypothetical protein